MLFGWWYIQYNHNNRICYGFNIGTYVVLEKIIKRHVLNEALNPLTKGQSIDDVTHFLWYLAPPSTKFTKYGYGVKKYNNIFI